MVVTAVGGAYAAVRWVFSERSQVLRERTVFHAELKTELSRQSAKISVLSAAIDGLQETVEIERRARWLAEQEAQNAKLELAEMRAKFHAAQASIHDLRETSESLRDLCRRYGVILDPTDSD
jgi:hypothetical protein